MIEQAEALRYLENKRLFDNKDYVKPVLRSTRRPCVHKTIENRMDAGFQKRFDDNKSYHVS